MWVDGWEGYSGREEIEESEGELKIGGSENLWAAANQLFLQQAGRQVDGRLW